MKSTSFKRADYIDHFLVFLLIANSGLPFFTNKPRIIVFSMILTIFFIKSFKIFSNKHFLATMVFLAVLIVGQTLTLKLFDLYTTATLFTRWIYPFMVLAVVKEKFPRIFINVMYLLTIVSLVIFIPSLFFPSIDNYLFSLAKYFEQISKSSFYTYNSNIIIYTIPVDSIIEGVSILKRLSGPFWEPGGYGSFLIVAVLFSMLLERKIVNRNNIVFLTAIFFTYSTAVFIALAVLLFGYGIWIVRNRFVRLVSPGIILLISYLAFSNLGFISERINRSIDYFQNRETVKFEKRDRMVSAIVDLETFVNYPVFGTGREVNSRFGTEVFDEMQHRNNGVTDFLVKYGLLFSVFYFYMIRKTFICFASKFLQKKALWGNIALVVILLIGFSQTIFQTSVFIAISYFSVFIPPNSFGKKVLPSTSSSVTVNGPEGKKRTNS
jgi:hypothetical protein